MDPLIQKIILATDFSEASRVIGREALNTVGASMQNVVRVTYVLPNAADFPDCWPTLRKYFGEVKPAAMMISAGLSDPRMRIEIEVTARHNTGT